MATLREQAREKLAERARLITENRSLIDGLEGKEWPAEDRAAYDKRWKDIDRLREEADLLVRQAEGEDGVQGTAPAIQPEPRDDAPAKPERREYEYRAGSQGYLAGKRVYTVDAEDEKRMERFSAYLQHREDRTQAEQRALSMDIHPEGGYTAAPQQFVADLIQAVDNRLFFRGLATVNQLLGAHTIGRPSLDADPADPTWTSEILTGDEDSTMSFGKRELVPHPLAQRIKVSRKLLRHSQIGAAGLVVERLGYKSAVVQEAAYMTGNGASQPLGIFTASDDGIGTGRDVSTGNTDTAITFDGLKSAKWALHDGYWARASWIFHPDAGQQIDKLKDGEGRYLWQASVVAGQPDRLLGFPVNLSRYAPNTFSSGSYVGILGDYSNYWIVESLAMEIQRLDELYAATNQVGFISRNEIDGMPTLAEAFVRVTLT